MQKPPQFAPRDSESNTPGEIVARLLFGTCLVSLVAGLLLMAAGVIAQRLVHAILGGIVFALAWVLRDWLRRRGRWEAASLAFDTMMDGEAAGSSGRAARLVKLLEQWDALEAKRGSPGFDLWALQAMRKDIQTAVDADPGLARLFHTYNQQKKDDLSL